MSEPMWLEGKPVYEWFEIPGTIFNGSPAAPTLDPADPWVGDARLAFCGMALRGTEIVTAAGGGHAATLNNEVTSIDIGLDEPVWLMRKPSSAAQDQLQDTPYYADGTPASRHSYWSIEWSETRQRVMLFGTLFTHPGGHTFPDTNGFDLATNAWDPAGTWTAGGGSLTMDPVGNGWNGNGIGVSKWTADTDTWTTTLADKERVPFPIAYDTQRAHLFSLAFGDGVCCGDDAIHAYRISDEGATRSTITFNPSDALAQFEADRPELSGMAYDPISDRYFYYYGDRTDVTEPDNPERQRRVFVITPNAGTLWDIAILELGPGSATPPKVAGAGVMSRFRYVPSLRGFVLLARSNRNLYFLRTSL